MPENDSHEIVDAVETLVVDEAIEALEADVTINESDEFNDSVDSTDDFDGDDDAEPTITFGDLGLPDGIVRKLAQNGVTAPFPIQAATIPDALAARTSSAVAAPAPARPSPSVCRPWPAWPVATPRRRSPARSSSRRPVSSRCRSRTPSSPTATCSA